MAQMSALLIHAQANDILGDAFEGQAGQRSDPEGSLLLMSFATAHRVAADEMRKAAKAEALALPTACTIDHHEMPANKCPLCGAPKR